MARGHKTWQEVIRACESAKEAAWPSIAARKEFEQGQVLERHFKSHVVARHRVGA